MATVTANSSLSFFTLVGPSSLQGQSAGSSLFTQVYSDGSVGQFSGSFNYNSQGSILSGSVNSFSHTTTSGTTTISTDQFANALSTTSFMNTGDLLSIVRFYMSGNDTITLNTGASHSLQGFDGDDRITGNTGADTILGDFGSDNLNGGGGNDVIYGGAAFAFPVDGADTIRGGSGSDVVFGNANNDIIYGGSGNGDNNDGSDVLFGGNENDWINGNGGADKILGGLGNDSLYGESGDDRFHFEYSGGQDIIYDFEGDGASGGDQLVFLTNVNGTGYRSASDVIADMTTDGTHAYINYGNGNGDGVLILYGAGLTANDIVVTSDF